MGRIGWIGGTASAVAVGLSVWFTAGWGGDPTLHFACNFGCLAVGLFALVCTVPAVVWSRGRHRAAWCWLAVAIAGWVLGSTVWAVYELALDQPPFPSIADAGYLLFPVAASVGMSLFPIGHVDRSRIRLVLDGLIVAAALFAISWVTVLHRVYDAGGPSRFALGLAMAYPVGDLVVVTIAVLVLASSPVGQRRTVLLLTSGAIAMGLSDSAFVFLTIYDAYQSGSIADVGWVIGMLLLGLAALQSYGKPTLDVVPVQTSKTSVWMPYVPIAAAIVVCTPTYLHLQGMAPMYVTSIILVSGVMARQFFVVRENRRLLEVVAEQALRDPLTGLANRALFNDRLAHAVQLHQRDGHGVAVLSLDLDHFKLVNDSLGHPAGDALLMQAAQRINVCARAGDTVARLGGDEFAVLVEGRAEHSRIVAHRVMQAFDKTFVWSTGTTCCSGPASGSPSSPRVTSRRPRTCC